MPIKTFKSAFTSVELNSTSVVLFSAVVADDEHIINREASVLCATAKALGLDMPLFSRKDSSNRLWYSCTNEGLVALMDLLSAL